MVITINNPRTVQYTGLCVPNVCGDYLQTPEVAKRINNTINEGYSNAVNNSDAILLRNLYVFSPVKADPKMGVGSIVSVAFILSLFAFEIVCSIVVGVKEHNA